MLPLAPDLVSRYNRTLTQASIPGQLQPHYRKWLRFYLDFCSKYDCLPLDRDSVRGFLRKLAGKGQAEWMRKQATDAVRLYFVQCGAARAGPVAASRQDPEPVEDAGSARSVGSDFLPEMGRTDEAASAGRWVESVADAVLSPASELPAEQASVIGPAGASTRRTEVRSTQIPTEQIPTEVGASRVAEAMIEAGVQDEVPSAGLTTSTAPGNWKQLHDGLADAISVRHYSKKTLKSYSGWAKKLQGFTRNKSPGELSVEDVKAFLTYLAVERNVSASSQNQAFNALLFVFRHVLGKEFGKVEGVVRAKSRPYVPVVLSRDEVQR